MKSKDVEYDVGDILVWKSYGRYFTVLKKKNIKTDKDGNRIYSAYFEYVMLDMKTAEVVEFYSRQVHTTAWKKKG